MNRRQKWLQPHLLFTGEECREVGRFFDIASKEPPQEETRRGGFQTARHAELRTP